MIGKLQGIVDFVGEDHVILMVGSGVFATPLGGGSAPAVGGAAASMPGVGYKVFTPDYLKTGEFVSLWIETYVREDAIRLFGFTSLASQDLFLKLTSVSGIGPKMGMAIMGAMNTNVLLSAIATGDVKTLTSAPGVGKKVAERLIVELKGKVSGIMPGVDIGVADGNSSLLSSNSSLPDLLSALESLGYRRIDVVELAQKLVRENPDADVGTLVRLALKQV